MDTTSAFLPPRSHLPSFSALWAGTRLPPGATAAARDARDARSTRGGRLSHRSLSVDANSGAPVEVVVSLPIAPAESS